MSGPRIPRICETCKGVGGTTRVTFSPRDPKSQNYRRNCDACVARGVRERRLLRDVLPHAEGLASFGSPIERECLEAVKETQSLAGAGAKLGIDAMVVRAHLSNLVRVAARRGYAPGNDVSTPTPEGFHVKGVSTYYGVDESGAKVVKGQWVKTKADEEHALVALASAMERIADSWRGLSDPIDEPDIADEDLLAVYPIGDPHLGMYSWAAETGHNWTLQDGERNLCAAVDRLVDLMPAAHTAIVLPLGDTLHIDNVNSTTTAGTRQDSDTRWGKLLTVAIRGFRRVIDKALSKHKLVIVRVEIGNHDSHASIMLALCLAQFYENNPRVQVDTSPAKYWYYRFGQVLVASTHTDTVKREALAEIMACDRPSDWGATVHRFWYTGHIHHDTVKELRGCKVESFRTLAPADKWHTDSGYRSGRDMKAIVLHKQYGEINRHTVGIGQLFGHTPSED